MEEYKKIIEGLQKILNDNPFDDRYDIVEKAIQLIKLQHHEIEILKPMVRSNGMK